MDGTTLRSPAPATYDGDAIIGSGEAMLPASEVARRELEFLRDMEARNLAYPHRTPLADAELVVLRDEIARWAALVGE